MALKPMLAAATGAALVLTIVGAADAQSRNRSGGEGQGTVTACSNYGNGCRSAPIRRAANDYEFRMPGGTWMSCQQSCKDTLRREVIDFWETQRENGGSDIN